ncbi:SET domain-containing protein 3 [Recurvomyces mirabilis]|nr:SET domain-containing protein 3 [Recurvomyces mirabilis]
MTESLYPDTTSIGLEPIRAPLPHAFQHSRNFHAQVNGGNFGGAQEDDGQISCFCGYSDDDGNTVACDLCNRWQHTICYYPEYEGRDLPDELQHFCIDCRPRPVDTFLARTRQQARVEQQDPYGSIRRQASKSHKKKIKDAVGSPFANGWPLDKVRHDRNSASPRDLPPPAKRPKTSHRPSDQVTGPTKGHSRKRTITNTQGRSASRSPESPISLYSEAFLRCYQDDDWVYSDANVMEDLDVTNSLSRWLLEPDDKFYGAVGHYKAEVLSRWDRDIDDIPKPALVVQEHHDPTVRDQDGNFPAWKVLTVQDPVADTGFIGELRGRIGFKEHYRADPSNRWQTLRHPEPFVFFHTKLPLYIDARNEGTDLRFVRRSCTPNSKIQVLITNGTDYHFCFMATKPIEPGDEISIGWDTSDSLFGRAGGVESMTSVSQQEMGQLSQWISIILANCGPCACQQSPSHCLLGRLDKRFSVATLDGDEAQPAKMPKVKKKKAGHNISPSETHAFNSRSGSEARKVDADDEPTDSRSASGSAGRNSASRDNTPNTHYSASGSLSTMPELSERERRKVAKEEEMFRRQEEEQSGKQNKKKRHSAGSTATTPGPSSIKHVNGQTFPLKYADAGTSRQAGLPTARSLSGRPPKSGTQKPSTKTLVKTMARLAPNYVDSGTQCDIDQEDTYRREAEYAAAPRRKYISLTQRLLKRCATNNVVQKKAASSISPAPKSAEGNEGNAAKSSKSTTPEEVMRPSRGTTAGHGAVAQDIDMSDASPGDMDHAFLPISELKPPLGLPYKDSLKEPHSFVEPPAPPWQPQEHLASHDIKSELHHNLHKPEMHVEMPPPTHVFGSTSNGSNGTFAQSPAGLTPSASLFPPGVTAAVNPSPARKKMSLSEYRQRKNKDRESESKGDRESSPASVASGPIAPSLLHSSSEAGVNHSQAIEDDVEMKDSASVGAG